MAINVNPPGAPDFGPNPLAGALAPWLAAKEMGLNLSAESLRDALGFTSGSFVCDSVGFEPMKQNDGLFASIIEQPAEDTPRLLYADWLDETAEGTPPEFRRAYTARAELIRTQIEIARGSSCHRCGKSGFLPLGSDGNPEEKRPCRSCWYHDAIARVTKLLDSRYAVPPPRGLDHAIPMIEGKELWRPNDLFTAREVRYVRGFVGLVSYRLGAFMKWARRVALCTPLEQVVLSDRALNPDRRPFGRTGYFFVPWEFEAGPTEFPYASCVLPEILFDYVDCLRDKDEPETATDCYRWLSWGCVAYARNEAGLPVWNPRPNVPLLKPLTPGVPSWIFGKDGTPKPLTQWELDNSTELEQAYVDRAEEVRNYKGFAALYAADAWGNPERHRDGLFSSIYVSRNEHSHILS